MPNLSLVLDTRRAKKNAKYPLKIRVHFKTTTFYLPLDVDLMKSEWDDELSEVTPILANSKKVQLVIRKRMLELEEVLLSISQDELTYFSGAQLKAYLKRKTEPKVTLSKYSRSLITSLENMNRAGSAIAYRQAINSLERFAKNKNLEFTDVSYSFLKKYEEQLIIEGKKLNSIAAYLRHIRAVFNRARNEEVIPHSVYPFNKYKIKSEKTIQRALKETELQKLWHSDIELNKEQLFALDMFRLTFCLMGINFSDLASLKAENLVDGRVVYKRLKTKKLYSIKLTEEAIQILILYSDDKRKYLLPILPDKSLTPIKLKNVLKQKVKMTNKHLKNIGVKMKLSIPVTTYVARYSWANIAKRNGFSNELIAEGLGHSYGNRTTAIYLDNFDKEEVDKMNATIIERIDSPPG